jgi:hypothetical protein
MGPLSVGNVVSASLRIYRDHFKLYYGLAFSAYVWLLVPVYGWAKYAAISALISRLVFSEVIERPETVSEARSQIAPRLWSFLGAGFLVTLIFFGVTFGAIITVGILGGVVAAAFGQNTTGIVILVLLALIALIGFTWGYFWLISRLFIVEVPLAIEQDMDATSAVGRSWKLTQGFVFRIGGIVSVAFLITLPISVVAQVATIITQIVLTALLPPESPLYFPLYFFLVLLLSFASGALLVPFWQAIKAVIYYDLRSRREGFGLQRRDSPW